VQAQANVYPEITLQYFTGSAWVPLLGADPLLTYQAASSGAVSTAGRLGWVDIPTEAEGAFPCTDNIVAKLNFRSSAAGPVLETVYTAPISVCFGGVGADITVTAPAVGAFATVVYPGAVLPITWSTKNIPYTTTFTISE